MKVWESFTKAAPDTYYFTAGIKAMMAEVERFQAGFGVEVCLDFDWYGSLPRFRLVRRSVSTDRAGAA
jgi:hypothetical protein